VIAAREKHQPWTIKREPDLFAVDASLEVAVSVPN
jgi:ribonuclease HII